MTDQNEANKAIIVRLITDVLNGGDLDAIDDLYAPELAAEARAWITPFRESFADVRMQIVALIAEGDQVVGQFLCSATHQRTWLGHPPTGRSFRNIAEISIYRIRDGRIVDTVTVEDNLERLTQLGLL